MKIDISVAFYLTDGKLWMHGEITGKIHSPCPYAVGEYIDFPEFGDHFIYSETGRLGRVRVVEVEHIRKEGLSTFPSVVCLWECNTNNFEEAQEALDQDLEKMQQSGFECMINGSGTPKPEPEASILPYTTMH